MAAQPQGNPEKVAVRNRARSSKREIKSRIVKARHEDAEDPDSSSRPVPPENEGAKPPRLPVAEPLQIDLDFLGLPPRLRAIAEERQRFRRNLRIDLGMAGI